MNTAVLTTDDIVALLQRLPAQVDAEVPLGFVASCGSLTCTAGSTCVNTCELTGTGC